MAIATVIFVEDTYKQLLIKNFVNAEFEKI